MADITDLSAALESKFGIERRRTETRITQKGDCWIWSGSKNNDGYGLIEIERGKKKMLHRLSYEAIVAPIPSGLQPDHLCRHHDCLNPEHMEPVTIKVNVLRGEGITAQNARKSHCPQGHKYDYMTPEGKRSCKRCRAAARDAYRQRQREAKATL